MKKLPLILNLLIFFLISCSSGERKEQNESSIHKISIDPTKTYTLKEASSIGAIRASADGLGTYKFINIVLENSSESSISVEIPAGSHFQNPNSEEQSLISSERSEKITLQTGERKTVRLSTFCTNARKLVPSKQSGWVYQPEYAGGLDEVISFYGNYAESIDQWLIKKNPEKFSTKEERLLFFQVVIWSYEGAAYQDIVKMLSQDVFADDIDAAKKWLDEIYKEAVEIAQLIKNKDSEGLKNWSKQKILDILPTNSEIDNAVDKTKEGINNLRNRLRN
jgi:hypothetical protein